MPDHVFAATRERAVEAVAKVLEQHSITAEWRLRETTPIERRYRRRSTLENARPELDCEWCWGQRLIPYSGTAQPHYAFLFTDR